MKITKIFFIYFLMINFAYANCDDKENFPNINQSLVLCPIHAYNIGSIDNPDSPEKIENMKKIIAMKTTVMTQQMKKQYDFLESTLKRFKIQLEKSILLNNMQANGAISEESSNKAIAGVKKCKLTTDTDYTIMCLQDNLEQAENLIDSGKVQEAKRILEQDKQAFIGLAKSFDIYDEKEHDLNSNCKTKTEIENCITIVRSVLIKIKRGINNDNTNNYNLNTTSTN